MQPVHAVAPVMLVYVPWGHGVAFPAVEYVPATVTRHCDPEAALYVPAGQLAEQVDAPTKEKTPLAQAI